MTGYYSKDKLLEVGQNYPFLYVKAAVLEDGKQYIILEDVYGMRHFLESQPYSGYKLEQNSKVICTVQKKNCTGRFYIEPLHPVYKPGEIYSFIIDSILKEDESLQLTLIDCFKNKIILEVDNHNVDSLKPGIEIKALVKELKKGIPQLILKY